MSLSLNHPERIYWGNKYNDLLHKAPASDDQNPPFPHPKWPPPKKTARGQEPAIGVLAALGFFGRDSQHTLPGAGRVLAAPAEENDVVGTPAHPPAEKRIVLR